MKNRIGHSKETRSRRIGSFYGARIQAAKLTMIGPALDQPTCGARPCTPEAKERDPTTTIVYCGGGECRSRPMVGLSASRDRSVANALRVVARDACLPPGNRVHFRPGAADSVRS